MKQDRTAGKSVVLRALSKYVAGAPKPLRLRGAVVLLDALGTRERDVEGSAAFLLELRSLLSDVANEPFYRVQAWIEDQEHPAGFTLQVLTFGDTLLISVGRPASNELPIWHTVVQAAAMAGQIISKGIERNLLWRGVLAAGDYVQTETAVIGPAVADAAAWYERGDWVGAFLTPRTELVIDREAVAYPKYAVPLKGRNGQAERMELHTIDWPVMPLVLHGLRGMRDRACAALAFRTIPSGAESKARHTLEYIEHLNERYVADRVRGMQHLTNDLNRELVRKGKLKPGEETLRSVGTGVCPECDADLDARGWLGHFTDCPEKPREGERHGS